MLFKPSGYQAQSAGSELLRSTGDSMTKQFSGLTARILLAMVCGLFLGVVLHNYGPDMGTPTKFYTFFVDGLLDWGGKAFIRTLKMLVVPIVLVSLIVGVSGLGDPKKLGRIGLKTLGLYLVTTAVAITIALTVATFVGTGAGADIAAASSYTPKTPPELKDVLLNIIPTNPFASMSSGNMLQLIFFAMFFGVSISLLPAKKTERLRPILDQVNDVVLKMIMLLMEFAPIGVFCLVTKVFADKGLSMFTDLLVYFFCVFGVLALQALVVYPSLLIVFARLNPIRLLKKMRSPLAFAFSTASSNATIPVTLKTVEEDLGVDRSVAGFTVPLGATINMDGTAIMQGVATVFIANAYNIDLGMADFLTVILTATLASVGTAGVPGAGMIMLAMVLTQVGLPAEGIGIVLGVDRLLDMIRTAVNITGDAVVTCIVAKSENYIKIDRYNS